MPKIGRCSRFAAKALIAFCLGVGFSQEALADRPGAILNVWPLTGGGPGGGDAFRIMYGSTGLNGEPIQVSAAIFIPPGDPPAGGRNVIAWAHPTSGVVETCAPSLMPDVAGMIWGLSDMLAKGYVVVATDYPGLGSPGGARLGARRTRLAAFWCVRSLRGVGPQPGRSCLALYR